MGLFLRMRFFHSMGNFWQPLQSQVAWPFWSNSRRSSCDKRLLICSSTAFASPNSHVLAFCLNLVTTGSQFLNILQESTIYIGIRFLIFHYCAWSTLFGDFPSSGILCYEQKQNLESSARTHGYDSQVATKIAVQLHRVTWSGEMMFFVTRRLVVWSTNLICIKFVWIKFTYKLGQRHVL